MTKERRLQREQAYCPFAKAYCGLDIAGAAGETSNLEDELVVVAVSGDGGGEAGKPRGEIADLDCELWMVTHHCT